MIHMILKLLTQEKKKTAVCPSDRKQLTRKIIAFPAFQRENNKLPMLEIKESLVFKYVLKVRWL